MSIFHGKRYEVDYGVELDREYLGKRVCDLVTKYLENRRSDMLIGYYIRGETLKVLAKKHRLSVENVRIKIQTDTKRLRESLIPEIVKLQREYYDYLIEK